MARNTKYIPKEELTTGGKLTFRMLGASNHTDSERQEDDYYATEPKAVELLLEKETFAPYIWECACGAGHIAKVLEAHGYKVKSTDLVYRGYGEYESVDFLREMPSDFTGDIVTNPPYKYALDFVKHALDLVQDGHKVAMFLRLLFLETKTRKEFFEACPPKVVYVNGSRLNCAKNGEFEKYGNGSIAYAWFVWEKGFKGDTILKWIN